MGSFASLHRSTQGSGHATTDLAAVDAAVAVSRTPGTPLAAAERQQASGWFGGDFSDVRVHTGPQAQQAANSINARAYTVGDHIVFGPGGAPSGGAEGRRLLAHELAHVVQQRGSDHASPPRRLSSPGDAAEREADAAAESVSSGSGAADTRVGAFHAAPVVRAEAEGEADETAAGSLGETVDDSVHDGDAPPGGPILPVATSPDQLPEPSAQAPDVGDTVVLRAPKKDNRTHHDVPATAKRWITSIDIALGTPQQITVHWSDTTPDQSSPASSGRGKACTADNPCPGNAGENCTPTGTFHPVFRGDANYVNGHGDHMSFYVDLGVADAQGKDRGIGIHDSQRVNGTPLSHGCVRVPRDMAKLVNENVTTATTVTISGTAATVAHRDKSCPAPKPRRRRPAQPGVHRLVASPDAEVARMVLDVGNGRSVGDVAGPAANTREDVVDVMDRMHSVWLLPTPDFGTEYPPVLAQPGGSLVALIRIKQLNAALNRSQSVDAIPGPAARSLLGVDLTGGVGPGKANRREDVLRLQHGLHAAWDLHPTPPLSFADAVAEAGTADPVDPARLVITRQALHAAYQRFLRGFPGGAAARRSYAAIPPTTSGAPATGTRTWGGSGLSTELTDGPAGAAGATSRDRVGLWLAKYRGVIEAAETRHGVDRRAIGAAIAWEGLINVARNTWGRQWSGPGKVHNDTAAQTESTGYLTPRADEPARLAVLETPVGAITYIAAVMQASADAADAGGYDLRADVPMLCFLYHAWDIPKSRGYFGVKKKAPDPLGYSGSEMAVWIAVPANLSFVTTNVGTPPASLTSRPRGY